MTPLVEYTGIVCAVAWATGSVWMLKKITKGTLIVLIKRLPRFTKTAAFEDTTVTFDEVDMDPVLVVTCCCNLRIEVRNTNKVLNPKRIADHVVPPLL